MIYKWDVKIEINDLKRVIFYLRLDIEIEILRRYINRIIYCKWKYIRSKYFIKIKCFKLIR